jgi:hypothetical protein
MSLDLRTMLLCSRAYGRPWMSVSISARAGPARKIYKIMSPARPSPWLAQTFQPDPAEVSRRGRPCEPLDYNTLVGLEMILASFCRSLQTTNKPGSLSLHTHTRTRTPRIESFKEPGSVVIPQRPLTSDQRRLGIDWSLEGRQLWTQRDSVSQRGAFPFLKWQVTGDRWQSVTTTADIWALTFPSHPKRIHISLLHFIFYPLWS